MPSPFPGMDPYLEEPSLWPDVHHSLITGIRDVLAPDIAPRYTVRIEERVFLCDDHDPAMHLFIPDISIRESSPEFTGANGATAAVATATVPLLIEEEIREYRVEVRSAHNDRIVTVIEVLSPANKVQASVARASYMDKRKLWLRSESHLVEIDLLRAGTRVPAVIPPPKADYYILVSRSEKRPSGQYYCIGLRQAIPPIPIPLGPGDPDTSLNLQAILRDIYDRARYDLQVDYRSQPPLPELSAENATWLDELLRERALR